MNPLAGNWTCVSAVVNGNPLPPETASALRLELTDERYATFRGAQVLLDSSYRIKTACTPHQIDISGTGPEFGGTVAQGIYELDEPKLRLCYTMPGGERPSAFASAPGSQVHLTEWRRAPTG